jgi:predicted site-specific integrase-resolvase
MIEACIAMRTYSTKQAAEKAEISRVTLERWLLAGKVRAPQFIQFNGEKHWRWTDRDVERVRKYKAANYRKGRGRKKEPKA